MIRAVADADLDAVRSFLEAHVDTSLFLLGNLVCLGPRLGEDPRSGNFKLVEEEGRIVAVFCLTRRGNLLVQAGGRTELAGDILAACRMEPMDVCGAIGEAPTAEAVWRLLRKDPGFVPLTDSREVLYALEPLPGPETLSPAVTARSLVPADFDAWQPLNTAFCVELDLPREESPATQRALFEKRARDGLWWGTFQDNTLVSIACLNAVYRDLGQVGGVYTHPACRRSGLSRTTMTRLIHDAARTHHLRKLVLFTGEDNGARRLYESLGFLERGAFALLLGERRAPG